MASLRRLHSLLGKPIFNYPKVYSSRKQYEVYCQESSSVNSDKVNENTIENVSKSKDLKDKELLAKTDNIESLLSTVKEISMGRDLALSLFEKFYLECKTKESVQNIISVNAFNKLSLGLERNLHRLEPYYLHKILVFSLRHKVPFSDLFMQKLFTLVLKNINAFTEYEVINIYRAIIRLDYRKNITLIALVKACKYYMEFVFQPELIEPFYSFKFINDPLVPNFIKDQVLLLSLEYDINVFTPENIASVFMGVNYSQNLSKKKYFQITKRMIGIIKTTIDKFKSPTHINNILFSYALLTQNKDFIIDFSLLDVLVQKSVDDKWGIDDSCYLIKILCMFPYINKALYNYIYKETSDFKKDLPEKIINHLLGVFSITGFHELIEDEEVFFKNQIQLLNSSEYIRNTFNKNAPFELIYHTLKLASLGIYEESFVHDVFNSVRSMHANNKLNELRKFKLWPILLLHQWVSVFHPNHQNKLSEEILEICFTNVKWELSIQNVVEKIFGGKDYVITNCVTSLYHNLNYVVILESNNDPVNLSSYKTSKSSVNIENMELPPYCKMVIIQEMPREFLMTFKNMNNKTNQNLFYQSVLKTLGCTVIVIDSYSLRQFRDLTSFEVFQYILDQIESELGYLNTELKRDLLERKLFNPVDSLDMAK